MRFFFSLLAFFPFQNTQLQTLLHESTVPFYIHIKTTLCVSYKTTRIKTCLRPQSLFTKESFLPDLESVLNDA